MILALLMVAIVSCASDNSFVDSTAPPLDPAQRVVKLETTGCGLAPDRTGSGVAIGDGQVLTVAHLVGQSDGITAVVNGAPAVGATVTAVDLRRDLALLSIPGEGLPAVVLATIPAGVGDSGQLVGGASSGDVAFRVLQVVRLSIEEVMGTDRYQRLGYELAASTATGDSGAGAYDDQNRLIGILFAISDAAETSWITSSEEIGAFLSERGADTAPIACDPNLSRLNVP